MSSVEPMSQRWDMATVFAIGRMYAEGVIDESVYWDADRDGLNDYLCRASAGLIAEMAATYAVDVHARDVTVTYADKPTVAFQREWRGVWSPPARNVAVEFIGGPIDGTVAPVRDVWQPWRVPLPRGVMSMREDWPPSPGFATVDYRLSGWDNNAAHWLMTATG